MQIGMECATVQLRSVEIDQIKLATAQIVKLRTDRPKDFG